MDDPRTEAEFLIQLRSELARIYHDISNPLAVVSGNLELVTELRKANLGMDEIGESLDDAQAAMEGFGPPLKKFVDTRAALDKRLALLARNDG